MRFFILIKVKFTWGGFLCAKLFSNRVIYVKLKKDVVANKAVM